VTQRPEFHKRAGSRSLEKDLACHRTKHIRDENAATTVSTTNAYIAHDYLPAPSARPLVSLLEAKIKRIIVGSAPIKDKAIRLLYCVPY
jgi:hypothetical protein